MAKLSDFTKPKNLNTKKDTNEKKGRGYLKKYDSSQGAFSQAFGNIDESGRQLVIDTVQPLIHPIETAKSIYALGKSILALNKNYDGDDNGTLARQVGSHFADRYGGLEKLKKTFATDPLGMLSDLSIPFTGGAKLATKGSKLASDVGSKVVKAANLIDPVNLALYGTGQSIKGATKTLPHLFGTSTGAGSQVIKQAYKSGAEGGSSQSAFRNNIEGKVDAVTVANQAIKNLKDKSKANSEIFMNDKTKLKLKDKKINIEKVEIEIQKFIDSKTDRGQLEISELGQKKLDKIQKILNDFKLDISRHDAAGLDFVKRKIDAEYPTGVNVGDSGVVVAEIRNIIKDQIVKQVPDYAKVMKAYEEAIILQNQLNKDLLSPTKNISATLKKLQAAMQSNVNTNYGAKLDSLKKIDVEGSNLQAQLAGQILNPQMPLGLANLKIGGAGVGGLALATSGSGLIPAAAVAGGTLAASSPRLVGNIANAAGVVNNSFSKINNSLPPALRGIIKPLVNPPNLRQMGILNQYEKESQNKGLLQ